MVVKTLKSDNHASKLASAVAELFEKSNKYHDVEVKVGTTIFQCHKMILSIHSSYFQSILFPTASRSTVHQITLEAVEPNDFQQILRFIYRGEIQLETQTVRRILRVAEKTAMTDLRETCVHFMEDTLDVGTCVPYWKFAEETNDSTLGHSCLEFFEKQFVLMTKTLQLQDITQEMMEAVIDSDDLNVSSEVEVCDSLLAWFEANSGRSQSIKPFQLLSLVRWSGISIEYIKSKMIQNDTLIKDQQSFQYLSKVISYGLSGIQFPGPSYSSPANDGIRHVCYDSRCL